MSTYTLSAVRTPIDRYGGVLPSVRSNDLAVRPLAALKSRNPDFDRSWLDDVILSDANQASDDNRSVARLASLGIRSGDYHAAISGGIESMRHAPALCPKLPVLFAQKQCL